MSIKQLRLQNLVDGFDNYGINPYQSPNTTFQQGPMDPTVNAQMPYADVPPPQSPAPPPTQPPIQPSGENWNRIKALFDTYTPETRATNRYNDLLDNPPEINTPSLGRKFVAAGAALGNVGPHFTRTGGGIEAADRVKYAPYINEMMDFKEKAGLFQPAAQQENTANVNERTLTGNMATAAINADRYDAAAKTADEKLRIQEEKNKRDYEVRSRLASVKEFLSRNADWELKSQGPEYVLFNPKTQEIKKTDIKTGELSELDAINAKGGYQVKAAEAMAGRATQAGATLVQDPDGNWYTVNPRAPGQGQVPVGNSPATPSGPTNRMGATPNTATEQIKARQERMNAIWDNYPEYRRFLKKEGTSISLRDRPGYTWTSGDAADEAEMAEYDKFRKGIDPTYTPPVKGQQSSQQPSDSVIGQPEPQGKDFSEVPKDETVLPRMTEEQRIEGLLKDPKLSPRNRDVLQGQLNNARATGSLRSSKNNNRRMEIEYLLENPGLTPQQRNKLQYELNGLPPLNTGESNISNPADLQQKAGDFLRQGGKPVTAANIDWVIRTGKVK